jgi:2-keto-3-deoxy-L-rhamnonate aldolase RhmA
VKHPMLSQDLRAGRRVYATAVVSLSPLWPAALAAAGVDFVFIDTEHTPLDRHAVAWMCRLCRAAGVPPVVRIPSPDPFEACKVLDAGAAGIIAPYIESADQVRALSGVTRFRPIKGRRLAEALDDDRTLEPELREYLARRNAESLLIVNIESIPAMEALDEILAVPGLDALLIGPHDLSCSLGIPEQYRHERFDAAVRQIIGRARAAGVGAGIHFWAGLDQEIDWARAGANLIMHSSDLALFSQGLKRELAEIRQSLGDQEAAERPGPREV